MKYLFILMISVIFISCTKYSNLYVTKPNSAKIADDNYYVFENDTVKITYSFWAEGGIMSYTFYNKLNIPIYIDWKKSSVIRNDQKSDYWADEMKTKSQTKFSSFSYSSMYSGAFNLLSLGTSNSGKGITNSYSVKPERITFLAPLSNITRVQTVLYQAKPDQISGTIIKDKLTSINGKTQIPVQYVNVNQENSPLIFRNFISISTTEQFEKESYIDNSFYISRIYKIKRKYFDQISVKNSVTKKDELVVPLIDPKRFFIKL